MNRLERSPMSTFAPESLRGCRESQHGNERGIEMEGLRERSYRRSGALARAAFTVLLVACSGLLAQESEPGNAGDVIKRMRETGKVNQGASTSLVG